MSEIMLHGVLNMPPELWNNDSPIDVMQRHSRYVQASKYIDELETELTAVTEQLKAAQEEIIKLTKGWADCVLKRSKAEDQRDRLAEALERIKNYQGRFAEEDPQSIAAEALQSLNPDHTVDANDMIAAVEGGADE